MSQIDANKQLGRLESVNIHDYWVNEATDFTPWLAQEENLAFLGEAIDIELEFVAREAMVGSFSADILCRNQLTSEYVLVENQLEKTDHSHLGQILTYVAGLKATTIIWIAREFREEHRAALDWLNEHTIEGVRFFGVIIELWRIGDSSPAPLFHVVSKPNPWRKPPNPELTVSQKLYLNYWEQIRKIVEQNPNNLHLGNPQRRYWMRIATLKNGVWLNICASAQLKYLRAEIYLGGIYATQRFQQLYQHKEDIEHRIGVLSWQELPQGQDSRIALIKDATDPSDEADWHNQHTWLIEKAKLFHSVFSPLVKQLRDDIAADDMDDESVGSGADEED